MRLRLIIIYTILLFSVQNLTAQYYETGQDPASLKWMQIKTKRFTVIYPKEYGQGGVDFARSLDESYSQLLSLFPEKRTKIPVIIHNYTTHSNGYVAWAPRRMELYPTPEQNTIPLSPVKQLTAHELTHVFQMESLNSGFSKAMSFLLGEQFTGITASLLPLWFLEGEAVFAESAITESGRGRSAAFRKQLKALTLEKPGMYKYDKIVNGSYRNFVPDHYESGYQMVTWAVAKYDHQIWNRALDNTARQPFTVNPVNLSLRKSTGLKKKTLFKEAFDSLKIAWEEDASEKNFRSYESFNPDKHGRYISYNSPVYAGDSIIAVKTSLSDPPSFVLINPRNRSERPIHIPGSVFPRLISYGNGKIVWVETQSDPRWENRNYSVIRLMYLKSRKVVRLSKRSRYLSASVSPDGTKVAAVENTISNKNYLVLLDAENGKVIYSVPAPGNIYLQRPQWSAEGEKISLISLSESGEGIITFSTINKTWENLLEEGRADLQSSYLRNDSLFFISSVSGTDNIYLRTPEGKVGPLTRSRFGTADLCLNGNNMLFADYSASGNNIVSAGLGEVTVDAPVKPGTSSFLIDRIDKRQVTTNDKYLTSYTPEPYRKWMHLFRFHSWMPFYADVEEVKADLASIRPGISVMSQNQLSTLISTIAYEYSEDKSHVLHTGVKWNGWYPVVESRLSYGSKSRIDKLRENVGDPPGIQPGIRFTNTVSLPLSFSSGKFSEFLQPSFTSDYKNNYVYIKDEGTYDYGQTLFSGRIFFSRYHRSALRDIYPRWAQTIDLVYSFAPFDRKINGTDLSIRSSFYFPGFLPSNGIRIRYEKEKQTKAIYLFSNRASFPRGYKNIVSRELEFFSADYVLPVVYPDLNIGSLLYLKRIRAGIFYDSATGKGNYHFTNTGNSQEYIENETFSSSGAELLADFHVLRIPYQISGGVQSAWKKNTKGPTFELLFKIDLFGLSIGRNIH
jgi:hypothetical protein